MDPHPQGLRPDIAGWPHSSQFHRDEWEVNRATTRNQQPSYLPQSHPARTHIHARHKQPTRNNTHSGISQAATRKGTRSRVPPNNPPARTCIHARHNPTRKNTHSRTPQPHPQEHAFTHATTPPARTRIHACHKQPTGTSRVYACHKQLTGRARVYACHQTARPKAVPLCRRPAFPLLIDHSLQRPP